MGFSATTAGTRDLKAMGLHQRHKEWIEARGISVELAEKFGLATVNRDGKAWLAVPYVERGKVVNHKYRLISEKQHQMDKGGKLDPVEPRLSAGGVDKPVVICEGEWDALVAIGLGWRAISVPNGASGGEGRLSYLWDARDLVNRVKHFILATDSDEAGLSSAKTSSPTLGRIAARSSNTAPAAKDLNDTLQAHGVEAVAEVLNRPSRSR
jgi:twinkle protein